MIAGTVLIVEPHGSGHRGVWLRWISEQLLAQEWKVVIATLGTTLHEPALSWLTPKPAGIEVVACDRSAAATRGAALLGLLSVELRYRRLLQELCAVARRSHAIDVVLLPYGDYALHAIALLGSPFAELPWIPILMRPTFHYAAMGVKAPAPALAGPRRWLFRWFLRRRSLLACLTIDLPLHDFLSRDPALRSRVDYLADPVDPLPPRNKVAARVGFGLPPDAVVVLVFGALKPLKGVQHLLPAVRALARTDLHVLCVGVADPDFRALLAAEDATALARAGRLHIIDRWADGETEAGAFAAADIVWLGYCGHWQSSGVQVQAGLASVSTVACDAGIIGWTAAREQCGLVVPVRQPAAVGAALAALADSPALRSQLGANGHSAFSRHTTALAGSTIAGLLRRAVSGEPAALRGRPAEFTATEHRP